jgi:hypothetical protein
MCRSIYFLYDSSSLQVGRSILPQVAKCYSSHVLDEMWRLA